MLPIETVETLQDGELATFYHHSALRIGVLTEIHHENDRNQGQGGCVASGSTM